MKLVNFCLVTLAIVFGLLFTIVETGFAQQANKINLPDDIKQYITGSLGLKGGGQSIIEQLDWRVREECGAVMRANLSDLNKEEEWLKTLLNNATERLKVSATNYHYRGNLFSRDDVESKKNFDKAEADFDDVQFEYLVTRCFIDIVWTCIEEQKVRLQEERWIRGNFTAKCNDPPDGITPYKYGRIEFQLFPDKSLKGTVYPKEKTVGMPVEGTLMSNDFFSLSSPGNRSTAVEVNGRISSYQPIGGSGSIWYGGEVDGYGRWQCRGKWESE